MGNRVGNVDGLIVTIFSMVVVFIVLIIISYLINLLKLFSSKGLDNNMKKSKYKINNEVMEDKVNLEGVEEPGDIEDNEELIAVIAAAIQASLGTNIPKVNIRSIKRIPQNVSVWAEAGRMEQHLGKL